MTHIFLLLILVFSYFTSPPVALSGITVEINTASVSFPNEVIFNLKASSSATIQEVVLEYRLDQLSCGKVVAKAYPDFKKSSKVETSFTWDMRQSGSLPPGAEIEWQWRIKDADGNETVTEMQTAIWLDDLHAWKSISDGWLTFHWYQGTESFARQLVQAGQEALTTLETEAGIVPDAQIHFYIYATTNDMRDAILYEPSWTGGMAFPEHNIVIIGINPSILAWGKGTVKHELTHVLIGHLTFSCLGFVPTWLNEGLAMYGEGGLEASSQSAFDKAVAEDKLLSVRSLSGSFSEAADQANLSYSQSYSLVNYLITTYGQAKILSLLDRLQAGETVDDALLAIYNFDVDGLEDAWRAAIGAQPRKGGSTAPTPTTPPTPVPTYEPVSGLPIAPTSLPTATTAPPTPTPLPTSPPPPTPTEPPAPAGQDSTPLVIGIAVGGLFLAGLAAFFFMRRKQGA